MRIFEHFFSLVSPHFVGKLMRAHERKDDDDCKKCDDKTNIIEY